MLAELSIVEHSDKYVVCQVVGTSASICITSEEFAYIRKNDKTSWINTLKLAIGGIIDTQAGPGPEALDPTKKVLTEKLAAEITENFDSLTESQKELIARKLSRVKVQERMRFKSKLPKELKYMISHVVVSRDGPAKHMTPSESAFLDEEYPTRVWRSGEWPKG